jgi:hypothetical protein
MERPRGKCAMLWLLDRATQLTNLEMETPCPRPLTCEAALKTTALAATLLFAHGQTAERTDRTVLRRQTAGTSELNPA